MGVHFGTHRSLHLVLFLFILVVYLFYYLGKEIVLLHLQLEIFQVFQYVIPYWGCCLPMKYFCTSCKEVSPGPDEYMFVEWHTAPTHLFGCCSCAVSNFCNHIQQPSSRRSCFDLSPESTIFLFVFLLHIFYYCSYASIYFYYHFVMF